ncbi:MAG: transcription antitermination factor NusB, partial [Myxococcota bacterium]
MSSQDSRGAAARDVAVEVVLRVTKDGAWTSRALDAALARASLQRRDAALATAIAYGTMRRLPSIDALIDRHAERTDPFLRAVLRCAIFEILHLDRVPVRAAVHEAVTAVRRKRGKKVAGFVNAVLRKIKRPD